jgi:hypothetical protein
MQKTRYLLYLVLIGLAFTTFYILNILLPHPPPEKQVDVIGMRLYKPIFFGEADAPPQFESTEKESEVTETETDEPEAVRIPSNQRRSNESTTYLEDLIKEYKRTVLSQRKYRNDVVVRYYRHEPDGDQVKVLSEYGFYIHERPIPDEKRFKNFGSNVIYYGHDFPESDLKLIAALLISQGMEIKSIQPFKDFNGWKHKSIEIGANSRIDAKRPMTINDVKNLTVIN